MVAVAVAVVAGVHRQETALATEADCADYECRERRPAPADADRSLARCAGVVELHNCDAGDAGCVQPSRL